MFGTLIRNLMAPAPARLPEPDVRLALAALLVRLARSDGHYADAEVSRIDAVLRADFGLGPFEAASLRGEAEVFEEEAPDTVRFTRALKAAIPHEERLGIIEALWEVALADGGRDDDENALIRQIAPLLGIDDQDSAIARQRVEARRG